MKKYLFIGIILFAFSFAEDESEYYFGKFFSNPKVIEISWDRTNFHFENKNTKETVVPNSCEELTSLINDTSYKLHKFRNEVELRLGECYFLQTYPLFQNPQKSYIKKETILKEIYNSELDSSLFGFELSNNIITTPSYSNVFNDIKSTEPSICDDINCADLCNDYLEDRILYEKCKNKLGNPHSHYPESSLIFEENSIKAESFIQIKRISLFGICDYNDDGYQDVIIEYSQKANQGSGYSGYTAIFTKESASSKFELIDKILGYGH